ncbi:MAG TPA: hypothetical protein DCM54_10950 [Gammaproteobacteria bacterium]|nr:hypothetical protein [Gammaproteobacteria bacterium]|tara:strand:+ start:1062 stop:1529 length:468 start_codon:yes stop_codon:yes gene_type:complete
MADVIATDSFLTEEQSLSLRALLDLIIPADADRGMPSAAELDLVGYVSEFASNQIAGIKTELESLDQAAQREKGALFGELEKNDQQTLCDHLRETDPRFAIAIAVQTLNCYYQDDRVVIALGWKARPPFPEGNEVPQADLSLLDPVRERGRIYRE